MHTQRAGITGSLVYLCLGLDGDGDKSRALDARAWRDLMKPAVCSMMELRGGVCSESSFVWVQSVWIVMCY
jgi:hypothetical protein